LKTGTGNILHPGVEETARPESSPIGVEQKWEVFFKKLENRKTEEANNMAERVGLESR
jgi:hypothetical protein